MAQINPSFRVIRYSPAPEYIELVNVALLFNDGNNARIVHDDNFPKLSCVAPNANLEVLRFLLNHIYHKISSFDPDQSHLAFSASSSQIQLTEPKALTRQLTNAFESKLVDLYLKRHHRRGTNKESQSDYIDSLLESVIDDTLKIPNAEIMRRASPSEFLNPRTRSLLKNNGFKISRVISTPKKLLLMDGVNFAVTSPDQLRRRAQDIGYAFYNMESVRTPLQEIEGKTLVRAAIFFNESMAKSDPKKDYLREILIRDSDIHADPTDEGEAATLKARAGSFLSNNLLLE